MHLHNLPAPYEARVSDAVDPAAWPALLCDASHVAWIAWNVREDAWYGSRELDHIQTVIDAAPLDLHGPELLAHIAGELRTLRLLSTEEKPRIPPRGVNHVAASWFPSRYDLVPESAFAEGGLETEIGSTWSPGDRFRVAPKGRSFAWLTFDAGSRPLPHGPDDILRNLGLDWNAAAGVVVRVEVPLDKLLASGVGVTIPTIFNSLCGRPPFKPDWRARPEAEHRAEEPWGTARDMVTGGAALPEVIMEITDAGVMDGECMGAPLEDWSCHRFLLKGGPR